MGAVLAKFRKEKSTTAVLERLESEIKQIEKYTLNTQTQKKRFVGNFLAVSIGIYVIAFIVLYFIYYPRTWKDYVIYTVPMLLIPIVIMFLRKLFTWYFQRKLNKNSSKLKILRDEKKRILEQVMDKETYKVAVNLLSRFGDKSANAAMYALSSSTSRLPSANATPLNKSIRSIDTQLNRTTNSLTALGLTPRAPTTVSQSETALTRTLVLPPSRSGQELRRRTPFPIVNQQDKSVFERIVDMLVGDGPQDRFAMICKECYAHNGMALKEEFDYVTFRCAFCNILNPSRKERPVAPRLPAAQLYINRKTSASSESTESSTSSDNEPELVPLKRNATTDSEADIETAENVATTGLENAAEPVAAKAADEETCDAARLHRTVSEEEIFAKKIQIDAALSIFRDELKKK